MRERAQSRHMRSQPYSRPEAGASLGFRDRSRCQSRRERRWKTRRARDDPRVRNLAIDHLFNPSAGPPSAATTESSVRGHTDWRFDAPLSCILPCRARTRVAASRHRVRAGGSVQGRVLTRRSARGGRARQAALRVGLVRQTRATATVRIVHQRAPGSYDLSAAIEGFRANPPRHVGAAEALKATSR